MTNLNEILTAATEAMQQVHNGIEVARYGALALQALDTEENTSGLDEKTVKAARRECDRLIRAIDRTMQDANDTHAALNDIARADDTIAPKFGK